MFLVKFLFSIWYGIIFESLPIFFNSDTQKESFHFGKLEFPHFVHEIQADSDKSFRPAGLSPEGLNKWLRYPWA